jgi:very-short-patch-repair endonuclease
MRLDKEMLDLAAQQRSQIAHWQIRELGGSYTEISRLRASSRWEAVRANVLGVPGAVKDDLYYASAEVLAAGPGACLTHQAATSLWGIPGFRLLPTTVSQISGRATRRGRPRGTHDLVEIPEQWVTRLHGIRVVRPELAAYQLCGVLSEDRAARTYDRFIAMRLLSVRSSLSCLHDLEKQGRDGTALYRSILKARGINYVAPATGIESRLNQLADEVGITLRRQVNLGDERFDGRVDFYEDDAKVVFEVQSELYHWALSDRQADETRRDKLEQDGFKVHEIWDTEIWTTPATVVQRMHRAIRQLVGEVDDRVGAAEFVVDVGVRVPVVLPAVVAEVVPEPVRAALLERERALEGTVPLALHPVCLAGPLVPVPRHPCLGRAGCCGELERDVDLVLRPRGTPSQHRCDVIGLRERLRQGMRSTRPNACRLSR